MSAAPPTLPDGQLPPIPSNIASLTCPLLYGTLFSWTLYGVLCVQVFIYSVSFPNDRRVFKYLVFGVFLLDTVQTALSGVDIWFWFGRGYGNLLDLSNPYLSIFDGPLLGSVIESIVQAFFCYRIWTLCRKLWLVCGIAFMSLFQLTSVIIITVRAHIVSDINNTRQTIDVVALNCWLVGGVVVDFIIAFSMAHLLWQGSSKKGEARQNTAVLNRIVRLTVETNVITCGVALLTLILYYARKDVPYYIAPTYVFGKIYSNTLLCQFNNRILLSSVMENGSTPSTGSNRLFRSKNIRTPPNTFHIQSTTTNDVHTQRPESTRDVESVKMKKTEWQ